MLLASKTTMNVVWNTRIEWCPQFSAKPGCPAVDVKAMRISRNQSGRNEVNAYYTHFSVSAPVKDSEARIALHPPRRKVTDGPELAELRSIED